MREPLPSLQQRKASVRQARWSSVASEQHCACGIHFRRELFVVPKRSPVLVGLVRSGSGGAT